MASFEFPDERGYFGDFGGSFAPEILSKALDELTEAFEQASREKEFLAELDYYRRVYIGRPTPLYYARRLSEAAGGAKIYLKREDLCHTGSHKLNNTVGQCLLAKRMGKPRVIAETGAGQHGVATATTAALFGFKCRVYMGAVDVERQALNVYRMRLLGSEVETVESGSRTLKDAINEAIRDWVTNIKDTHYVIGSVVGMHPYPKMVRFFQSIIGREAKQQFAEAEGGLPAAVVACVGGGSNAMGAFYEFLEDETVRLVGVEAGGEGLESGKHAASLNKGSPGVLHGALSYVLQDEFGQITETHSISAGLDYPGVGPEHAWLKSTGRAEYVAATDREALEAFVLLSRTEGIIPALESAHAVAHAVKLAAELTPEQAIIVCLSGRGDKDAQTLMKLGVGQ